MATIATPTSSGRSPAIPAFPSGALAITPNDTDVFATGVAVYVGVTGNVVVRPANGGSAVTFVGAQAGSVLPITVIGVNATSTTATSLLALY